MENNIIKVYGYIRVSTESQAKMGFSLAEQQAEIESYCSSKSYKIVRIFKDEGISGAKANEDEMCIERDGLLDMLTSLKEKDIQYVVVLSTNRLWRSDFVKILIHRELKKNQVDIIAIDRPSYSIYTKNPNDVLINGVFETLDEYERLEIALKLKRGRIQKAKSGGYAGGGVQYGYSCSRGSKRIVINREEAEAVQRVFHLKKLFPSMTLQRLSEYMDAEGYMGRNGKRFTPMLVKRILDRKEFYKGNYCYAGICSKGDYEPILLE